MRKWTPNSYLKRQNFIADAKVWHQKILRGMGTTAPLGSPKVKVTGPQKASSIRQELEFSSKPFPNSEAWFFHQTVFPPLVIDVSVSGLLIFQIWFSYKSLRPILLLHFFTKAFSQLAIVDLPSRIFPPLAIAFPSMTFWHARMRFPPIAYSPLKFNFST